MEILEEMKLGELEGTRIKRMKDYIWHIYNWDTNKDVVVVRREKKKGNKMLPFYRVERWGEKMTGDIRTYKEAEKFAVEYVELKV